MKSSAVMKEPTEDPVVSDPLESRVARIESDVEHIKEVTTDLRVELRRTNDRMDAGFQAVNKKIDDGYKELNKKIDDGLQAATKKTDDVHHSLRDRIDSVNNKLNSMALWALLLYVTLAGGLLTVIARSFKWI